MTSLLKKAKKNSPHLGHKIQQLKNKQLVLETKMVQQLLRALKTHQGFSLPFPILMGGMLDVMEQVKANSHQAEVWTVAGRKFLRQRSRQPSNITSSKNNPAISKLPTAMEKTHDQA